MSEYWYQKQMMDWIEYAEAHRFDQEHKTIQTARQAGSALTRNGTVRGLIGGGRGLRGWCNGADRDRRVLHNNRPTPFNTWTLYRAWKSQCDVRCAARRIHVLYSDAIPELQAYLDWMEAEGIEG